MSAQAIARPRVAPNVARLLRRNAWTLGTYGLFVAVMIFTVAIHPNYGPFEVQSLVVGALPLAFAAVAEACVVLGGGIDLSIGAMMAVANVVAARYMNHHDFQTAILVSVLVLVGGTLAGALNGVIALRTRVPDIVVTLAARYAATDEEVDVLETPFFPRTPLHVDRLRVFRGSADGVWRLERYNDVSHVLKGDLVPPRND